MFVFFHDWDWSWVFFLAQLTFIEFLFFVPHSVKWQVDCLYLFDSAFFVVVNRHPTVYPFEWCDILPHYEVFLTSRDLKIWFIFFLDQVSWFFLLRILLNSVYIFMEHDWVLLKTGYCFKILSFLNEQKSSNVKSQRAQCVGTLCRWTFQTGCHKLQGNNLLSVNCWHSL